MDSGLSSSSAASPTPPARATTSSLSASSGAAMAPIDLDAIEPIIELGTKRTSTQRADVWDDFVQDVDKQVVKCVHCSHELKFISPNKTGTSSMRRHQEICKVKKPRLEAGQQLLPFSRQKVPASFKLHVHDLVQRWVVRDQQSFNVLDHPDFRAIFEALSGDYKPPTRNIMTRKIRADFDQIKTAVKDHLALIKGRLALTTDGWTAANGDQFQAVTAHYVDNDWKLQSLILDFVEFPVPHTADNAAHLIMKTLRDFDLEQKVSACVTDNTASAYNISTLLKQRLAPSPFFPGRCAAHLINLTVKHGLEDCERDETFGACRSFVTLLHRSSPTKEGLKAACRAVGIQYVLPPTVMEVRWNSTLAQLSSLLRLEAAIRHMFENEFSTCQHAWGETVWTAMRDISKVLTIFKDVSEHLQGRKFPTIGAAAEGFVILTKYLRELRLSGRLTLWGVEVVKLFEERLKSYCQHLIDTSLVQWSTILDPSMKLNVLNQDGVHSTYPIIQALGTHLVQYYPSTEPEGADARTSQQPLALSEYEKRRQKLRQVSAPSSASDPRQQLELYLAEQPIISTSPSDALRYWEMNAARFPSLASMARDILAVPATSSPSETAFSRGGELITKRRNRLLPGTLTHIMFLDSWLEANIKPLRSFKDQDLRSM